MNEFEYILEIILISEKEALRFGDYPIKIRTVASSQFNEIIFFWFV